MLEQHSAYTDVASVKTFLTLLVLNPLCSLECIEIAAGAQARVKNSLTETYPMVIPGLTQKEGKSMDGHSG